MFNETRRAAWTEIDLGNVVFNYSALRNLAGTAEVIAEINSGTSLDSFRTAIADIAWATLTALVIQRTGDVRVSQSYLEHW